MQQLMILRGTRLTDFRSLVLVAVSLTIVAVSALAYTIWNLRDDAIEGAYASTGNNAALLAEQTAQTVHSIDSALVNLQRQIHNFDVGTPTNLASFISSANGYALLKEGMTQFPEADVVSVLDAKGYLIATSRSPMLAPMDMSDRGMFRHFKASPTDGLYVSFPFRSRLTSETILFFSRPLFDRAGSFVGIVNVGLPITYFKNIYESVRLLKDETFLLLRDDGTILVRYPDAKDRSGEKIAPESRWHKAFEAGGGTFRSAGRLDPVGHRLISLRLVPKYPLVVTVGISEHAALAVWQKRSLFIALGSALILACSLLLSFVVTSRVRLLKQSQLSLAERSRELGEAKALVDAAVDNISQGITMFDGQRRLLVCNARFIDMYGLSRDVVQPGALFEDIMAHRRATGSSVSDRYKFFPESARQVLAGEKVARTATLMDGRIIALVSNPMPQGGWVTTHEDISERHREHAMVAHMARHDALTGLANRISFDQAIADAELQLRRRKRPFGLMLADLDRFKSVNDTHGHPTGDALLISVAGRLVASAGDGATVARLGGDEFAILLPSSWNPQEQARGIANRLLDSFTDPFEVDGHIIQMGLSIGISIAPNDGMETEILIRRADIALYQAKEAGRNRLRFFDLPMEAALPAKKASRVV
jgi:diguanylate cyclase (GGDEF)-like protein